MWLLLACTQASPDEALLASIHAAAAAGITAEEAAAIEPAAMLSTLRSEGRFHIQIVDLAADPGLPEAPAGFREHTTMLWDRPVEAQNPRVVGLTWPNDSGPPVLFYGQILPP